MCLNFVFDTEYLHELNDKDIIHQIGNTLRNYLYVCGVNFHLFCLYCITNINDTDRIILLLLFHSLDPLITLNFNHIKLLSQLTKINTIIMSLHTMTHNYFS